MIDFLNTNAGTFNLIFSFFVMIATVIYAVLTWKLVKETKRMRELQSEPKVSITAEFHETHFNFLNLKIQNIGLGPAYSLRFKVLKDFEYDAMEFVSGMGFVKNGINYLSPGHKIETFFTSLLEDFERKLSDHLEIEVTYLNAHGKEYKDTYLINFSYISGLSKLGSSPIEKIAKSIEKIETHIKSLSKGAKH
jgi:hypothetical protein